MGTITVSVLNTRNFTPVEGASVKVEKFLVLGGTEIVAQSTTNSEGKYVTDVGYQAFQVQYRISVTKLGFKDSQKTVTISVLQQDPKVDFQLEPTLLPDLTLAGQSAGDVVNKVGGFFSFNTPILLIGIIAVVVLAIVLAIMFGGKIRK